MDLGQLLQKYFTPEMVTSIVSIITLVIVMFKLATTIKKLHKEKSMTVEDACDKIIASMKNATSNDVKVAVEPLANKLGEFCVMLDTFSKIFALSQENTPESRIAILELIKQLGNISGEIVNEAKQIIEKEIEANEENKKNTIEQLDKIIEDTKPVE